MFLFVFDKVEDILRKGVNAVFQHFLLFPQCFQKLSPSGSLKVGTELKRGYSSFIGIEEAFLEVAKRLIKLYETSPTSGIHSADTLNYVEQNTDEKIHIEPPSRHKGPPPSSQDSSKCGC